MKILKRSGLLKLDGEHVFYEFAPCYCGAMQVFKGKFSTDDFLFDSLSPELAIDDDGELDYDNTQRDGRFNHDQLYCVLSKDDMIKLVEKLQFCIDTIK